LLKIGLSKAIALDFQLLAKAANLRAQFSIGFSSLIASSTAWALDRIVYIAKWRPGFVFSLPAQPVIQDERVVEVIGCPHAVIGDPQSGETRVDLVAPTLRGGKVASGRAT
jgi:hypothetical protein